MTGVLAGVNARLERVDILVNNAGANLKERTFRQLTPDSWRQMLGANLDTASAKSTRRNTALRIYAPRGT